MDLRDQLGTALGDSYRLEQELGGGGMSRVFLAEEIGLGRKVVVKVLPPEMAASVNEDRFRREIQLAARLQHPHIVPLLAAGSARDLLYYTMPLIKGESTAQPWIAPVVPSNGSFQPGSATAKVGTTNAAPWVPYTEAGGPVKLYWSRR